MKILVTGANGFIGQVLCPFLKTKGHFVRGVVRSNSTSRSGADEYIQVENISGSTDWGSALIGIDTVIHLAARVHVMNDQSANPLEAFRQVNVQGTEHLARLAAQSGVKRFLFISSVKVNGEGSDHLYTENDPPAPEDAYGISKKEAEAALKRIAIETGLEVVILRLPLVYGPGVKANFRNLIKLATSGVPLPFKGIQNQRSLVYLGNMIDAIATCIVHPLAAGETFLVSDGEDVSTPELITLIASAMNKKAALFPLPVCILKALAFLFGQSAALARLTGSLCVDSSKIRSRLGWLPPFTLKEGIAETIHNSGLPCQKVQS